MQSLDVTLTRSNSVHIGNLCYDFSKQSLSSTKDSIYLRCKLNEVLLYLVSNKGRLVSREELIQNVWGGNVYTGENAVTHTICKLRRTINKLGLNKTVIKTVSKRGYVLDSNQLDNLNQIS